MKPEIPMSATTNPNIRYTMDSVRAMEAVKEQIGGVLRDRATERALHHDRDLVTAEDVFESTHDTLRIILEALAQKNPQARKKPGP
jgi:hypothetical protein